MALVNRKRGTIRLHFNYAKFSTRLQSGFLDVEEIGDFCCDSAVSTTGKGVFLRVFEHIAQSIEIAAFDNEMVPFLCADIHSKSASNAVLELLLHIQFVLVLEPIQLTGDEAGTVASRLLCLAYAETQLGADDKETFHASPLTTKAQIRQQRNLNIVNCALIQVVACVRILLPTSLRIIHLSLNGTKHLEVLLASISSREAHHHTALETLLDRGFEHDFVHDKAAIHAHSEVCARLTDLSVNSQQTTDNRQQKEDEAFHRISSILLSGVK